jgi:hypothetical protein
MASAGSVRITVSDFSTRTRQTFNCS